MDKLDVVKRFNLVENLDLVEEWICDTKLDLEDLKEVGSEGKVNHLEKLSLVKKLTPV